MRKLLVSAFITCVLPFQAGAQGSHQSFQEFRKGLHSEYEAFRSRIFEHYADFLEGEWHPYEPLRVGDKNELPKPAEAPRCAPAPVPVLNNPAPVRVDAPAAREVPLPASPAQASAPEAKMPPAGSANDEFDFYGMTLAVPQVDFNILRSIRRPADTAAQWKALDKGRGREAAAELRRLADGLGFNAYLTFRLGEAYLRAKFPDADLASVYSALHYMMLSMGYDARLALSERNVPLMLIPFVQKVYASIYLNFDGVNYTAFLPEGASIGNGEQIYTCTLPSGAKAGEQADLRLNGLRLPFKPYKFEIKGGGLQISGEVNENLFKLLYRYPQMPTEDFASSVLDGDLRGRIAAQVRAQLEGKSEEEAVNALMSFFHEGFEYATDEQRHGFEKPYFLEETLYYDKCDCEDRAIMFTWLVWNALGLPVHMNAYPGHESAAVAVDSAAPGPYSYTYGGKIFRNTDPTYIGSKIGDVMPQFASTAPKIDKIYE